MAKPKEVVMKKTEFIARNINRDRLAGRPIRLNRINLTVNQKGYAPLLFMGDIHWGHPQCNEVAVYNMLDWVKDTNTSVLLMGDLLEAGLRDSIGDSVYAQNINPQKQMEEIVGLFEPLAKKKLIVGLLQGNHEQRITKATSIDISKIMAKDLGIPYLGYSCWNWIKVSDGKQTQNYSLYATHGKSGAKFKHTKLKAVVDLAGFISADIIAMGHVHSLASEPVPYQQVDWRNKVVKTGLRYVVLTGSYLEWDKSYAQQANMPITKIGSPKAKLRADHKDVHFSL